ncbi:hypothetical protein [Paenarthrobacter sp. NPDC018779]|uniref:hypothetical protein n=1 Tax=Paenarthrobacter sp. NPDC018779 TaxID=3364375 RepID=UPI0037CB9506
MPATDTVPLEVLARNGHAGTSQQGEFKLRFGDGNGHSQAPAYDHADITSVAAATVVFDLLALMVNRGKATAAEEPALEAATA